MHRRPVLFALAVLAVVLGSAAFPLAQRPDAPTAGEPRRGPGASSLSDATRAHVVQSYGTLPLSFSANEGATDGRVRFLSRGPGYTLFLTDSEAVLRLDGPSTGRPPKSAPSGRDEAILRMRLLGANPTPVAAGLEPMAGKSHYFIGDDPSQWRADVSTYSKVRFASVYPGIDLVYYGNQRQLEYDFVLAPGADPSAITLGFRGADRLQIDRTGDLVLQTGAGEVRWRKPVIYQEVAGERKIVDGRFVRKGKSAIGFQVGHYDRSRELIIDPVLVYSTYLGGSTGTDVAFGIAVDAAGNAYVTGRTTSTDFPTTNALQPSPGGVNGSEVFVSKLNAAGNALMYSTYLGGTGREEALSIAVDSAGNAYVTGDTSSSNFPRVNAFQTTLQASGNAFVSKLNAAGNALLYSTYLGGSASLELGYGIAVNDAGHAYVVGMTNAANFPVKNAIHPAYGGNSDGWVSKLDTTLSGNASLVYSTYLGGANLDYAHAIAIDTSGNAYVTGVTLSANFPITAGAFQSTMSGVGDAYVTKLNSAGNAVVYSTYLGGSAPFSADDGRGIAVDPSGAAYVVGYTGSTDFPTLNGYQTTFGGGSADAFVAKLDATGSALLYATYLGGNNSDIGAGIALDAAGSVYVAGRATSVNFPTVDPLQGYRLFDSFVAKLDTAASGSASLVYSSFFGGSGEDIITALAVDSSGDVYVTGTTHSLDLPTVNPIQATSVSGDAFVSKFHFEPTAPGLDSIAVTPANPSIALNMVQQFTAIRTFADSSTQDVTNSVTWTSVTPGVASITAGGLASALTTGTSVITATSGTISGSTTLTVFDPQTFDFTVSASPASLALVASTSKTAIVTVRSTSGSGELVHLTAEWLGLEAVPGPANTTLAIAPALVSVPSNGSASATLALTTTPSSTPGTYGLRITGTSNSGVKKILDMTVLIAGHSGGGGSGGGGTGGGGGAGSPTCACTRTGAFVDPGIKGLVQTSPIATVTTSGNQLTLSRNADGRQIITDASLINGATFGFSPNGKFFVLVSSASLTLYSIDRAAPVGPRDVLNVLSWGFSPDGDNRFFMVTSSSSVNTHAVIDIYDTGTGAHVMEDSAFYSAVPAWTDESGVGANGKTIGGMGFSPDGRTFVLSYKTGATSYLLGLWNLTRTNAPILGATRLDVAAFWQFSPCGDLFMLVSQAGASLSSSDTVSFLTTSNGQPYRQTNIDLSRGAPSASVAATADGSRQVQTTGMSLTSFASPQCAAGQPPTNLPAPTCGCTRTGAFVSPQIKNLVPTSSAATVTTTANQLTLRRNSDNHVIINGATNVSAFGFSPNGKFFVLITSLTGPAFSLTLYSVDLAAPIGARDVLNARSWGFSPDADNRYFMVTTSASLNTHALVDIYDTRTGRHVMEESAVYSTVPAWTDESGLNNNSRSVGGMGFSPDGHTFVLSYKTGATSYLFGVWNLTQTNFPVLSETRLDVAAFWQFSPCGDLLMLVSQAGANLATSDTVTFLHTSNGQPYRQASVDPSRGAPSATVVTTSGGGKQIQLTGMSLTTIPSQQCTISATVHSPVNIALEDPLGRRTGVDPATNGVVSEIPGGSYTGVGSEPQTVTVPYVAGTYLLDAFGLDSLTSPQPYRLTFTATDASGDVFDLTELTAMATRGTLHRYVLEVGEGPLTPHDAMAPEVQCAVPDGQWHASNVNLTCTAADGQSGLANPADAMFALSTEVPTGTETSNALTDSRQVCDKAGNCVAVGPFGGNKVDRKPPSVTIAAPSGSYLLGQIVAASYSCLDGGSGLTSCSGPVANGASINTQVVGANAFMVNATDNAGNRSSATASYTVGYGIRLLYVDVARQSDSTYPIKVQLTDARGNNVSSPRVVVQAIGVTVTSSGAPVPLDIAGNANPGLDFRYDAALGGYIFNLQLTGYAPGAYSLQFTVGDDPTVHNARFKVR